MFLKAHIWKRGIKGLTVAALTLVSLGVAASAYAASETYTWTSTANTSITASGGALSKPLSLSQEGVTKTDGSADFTGSATVTCGTATATGTIKITVDGSNYKQIYPSLATITAPPALACANFDSPIAIASSDGTLTAGAVDQAAKSENQCDQGSLSWIMCPAIDNISGTISRLAKSVLVPLLEVNRVTPTTTPQIYAIWESIRNFTDILFILVFFLVIFATLMQQDVGPFDRYTVRKIWPRLVTAAIIIQFSFYLCGFLIDIGNILGAGVETLMASVVHVSQGAPSLGNLVSNLLAGGVGLLAGAGAVAVLASWTAAVPLLLSLLLSLLAVFLTLGARFIVIGLLIIASPLAILAWVLPNTRKYATDWGRIFVRLILMYPLIVGILSVAGMVNELLPFGHDATTSAAAGVAVSVVTPLITIAAFVMIPFTFKLAGKGVGQLQSFITATTNRGQKMLKGSELWEKGADQRKRTQAGLMNQLIKSDTIKSLKRSGSAGRGAAAVLTFGAGTALLNGPKSSQSIQKAVSSTAATAFKQIGELDEATVPMLQKVADLTSADAAKRAAARRTLQVEAPNLLRIASTPAGRTAVRKVLADKGLISANDITGILNAPKGRFGSLSYNPASEFPEIREAAGKEFSAKPAVLARITEATDSYEIKDALGNVVRRIRREVGDVDINTFGGLVRGITSSAFGDKHTAENFKQMGKRNDPKATALEQRAAEEIATEYAKNLDVTAVDKAFDPGHKDFASRGVRYEWLKNAEKNRDVFAAEGPRVFEAALKNFERDEDITTDIMRLAGISEPAINSLSATAKARVARDWMRGTPYDPSYDYETKPERSVPLA